MAGTLYRVDEHTPVVVRKFLSEFHFNNRFDSEEQLKARAENYLAYIEAEKKLIDGAHSALQDTQSPVFKQSAWLCHLERGIWQQSSESTPERLNRKQLGNEAAGTAQAGPELPYARPWPWPLSPVSASTVSMMVKGEAGPFTLEQTRTGFESVQEGVLLGSKLFPERKTYRVDHRHDARRDGTHPTKTLEGTDLSQDEGTQMRDAFKVPVMTGRPDPLRTSHWRPSTVRNMPGCPGWPRDWIATPPRRQWSISPCNSFELKPPVRQCFWLAR
ncbi:hypothetical protein AU476_35240 [Cupriavidus sp. UYMSc13B]|nr:hypothetical protein AU476_35240 [Cupriavidus sp. UYMSc13B]